MTGFYTPAMADRCGRSPFPQHVLMGFCVCVSLACISEICPLLLRPLWMAPGSAPECLGAWVFLEYLGM